MVGEVTLCAQKPKETSTEKYVVKPGFQLVQNTVFLKLPEARSSSEQAPLSLLEDNTSSPPQSLASQRVYATPLG